MDGFHLTYIILGGFEKFEEPIQIIIPSSVNGVLCFKSAREPSLNKTSPQLKYWVQDNGYLEIDFDLLRSHRKMEFYKLASTGSAMTAIPHDKWTSVVTNYDAMNDAHYGVFWLGTRDDWMKFDNQHGGKPYCLPEPKARLGRNE